MKQTLDLEYLDIETNPFYVQDPKKFNQLRELVKKYPHNYFSLLKLHELDSWVDCCLPLLHDIFFKKPTKVYWILHGLIDFQKCKTCGNAIRSNVLSISLGHYQYCSKECAHKSLKKKNPMNKYAIEKREFDSILQKLDILSQLRFLVENYEDNYSRMISCRKWLKDFVDRNTLLNSSFYKMSTKLYWIFNDIHSWDDPRVCCKTCRKPHFKVNIMSLSSSYPRFCSQKCAMKDPDVLKKIEDTCIQKYGVKSPAQNHEIQKKTKAIYEYDNYQFKSSWEVAFYIWNIDNKNDVIYTPTSFQYQDQYGISRRYFPDFSVNGKLYEIKGNHFISENGEFQNPYDHSLDASYELKRQCALANNVCILDKTTIQPYLQYVSQKYGKDYIQKFRKQNSK